MRRIRAAALVAAFLCVEGKAPAWAQVQSFPIAVTINCAKRSALVVDMQKQGYAPAQSGASQDGSSSFFIFVKPGGEFVAIVSSSAADPVSCIMATGVDWSDAPPKGEKS